MLYLGWIAAAFLTGIVLMLLRTGHRPTLRQRSEAVGAFRGMRYDEVVERLERAPQCTLERPDGQTLRRWEEDEYSITLLFEESGVCLGVEDERTVRKTSSGNQR